MSSLICEKGYSKTRKGRQMTSKTQFTRGYKKDAGVDIILEDILVIRPGFQTIDLKVKYCPGDGEVAFLISRGSTANKGIFPIMVAIDTGYEGTITAWVVNTTNKVQVFNAGDRAFGIVNLKLGEDRVEYTISKEGERGSNKVGSSGGIK